MAGVKEIKFNVSRVAIRLKNGNKVEILFADILASNENDLKTALHRLERWIEDLKRYRDGVIGHGDDIAALWDEAHTREIRSAITTCAEEIDESIQFYETTAADLTTPVNAIIGTHSWLASNPQYNTPKKGYIRMGSGGSILGVEISYP